jgi:hypothetical protein
VSPDPHSELQSIGLSAKAGLRQLIDVLKDTASMTDIDIAKLPPLAGIASLQDAMKPGLSVERCVARLKRFHYAFKRLHQIFTARITAEPIYELKTAFSLHAWLCAEHVTSFHNRVAEMREPPLGLDAAPDAKLEIFFDEILAAPTTQELVVGLYDVALPALREALQRHIDQTNPLADHPSVRACRMALFEVGMMLRFGTQAVAALAGAKPQAIIDWTAMLDNCLANAGGIDGALPPSQHPIVRMHSQNPYTYDAVPQRDARFIDPFNRGVNPEGLLYDDSMPDRPKTLMLYFKRIREIDVPEMMASIISQTTGKPWDYYRDMTRQLWDEARHAMMGEVGFASVGVDWTKIPVTWTWSRYLNTQLTPLERHGVLYFIEQGLMPKTGKRYEWEVARAAGDELCAIFQDYDWADEVLHAAIGRQWYVKEFPTTKEATDYGQQSWSKLRADSDATQTAHRNWWPDVYLRACRFWQTQPDPRVLEYDVRYKDTRELTASG